MSGVPYYDDDEFPAVHVSLLYSPYWRGKQQQTEQKKITETSFSTTKLPEEQELFVAGDARGPETAGGSKGARIAGLNAKNMDTS
ncbi:unnamed protein product [Hermetia illucens]|uniref:Uncharacterized protein n=1 Tax=Hermetia illucens TaxID=343691 RepID=A0A7R8V068_HERIL|nr:unnamed protein product [Hermetia illucens]